MIIKNMMEAAHINAVNKGFGNVARNQKETLMLIVSELGEAVEAHRKGKFADTEKYHIEMKTNEFDDLIDLSKAIFEKHIKDSYEDELADTMIRIGNYVKEFGIYQDIEERNIEIKIANTKGEIVYESSVLDIDIRKFTEIAGEQEKEEFNSGECMFDIVHSIIRSVDSPASSIHKNHADRFGDAILGILRLAVLEGIDLQNFIELKMEYNTTREYMHGKNY